MGKIKSCKFQSFGLDQVQNKELIIQMLKYEEEFTKSEDGQKMYKNPYNEPYVSLNVEKAINRIVLSKFGYDTSDTSVENYRTIFRTYYNSPTNYDADVLNSVHYMRENKIVYYKNEPLKLGSVVPNCRFYSPYDVTEIRLYECLTTRYTLIGAFSLS